ncbi:MAG: class E sortase [Actinomycetota bacterium]|jgi:sortase A|nr:class E sortase [Actinomycetota bacterium]
MSLLLIGVGLALSATFFVGSPFTSPAPAAVESAAKGEQPEVPAIAPRTGEKPQARLSDAQRRERRAANVPDDKTLRVTIPAMKRVENATIPYAGGFDEDAFKNHAGVHVRGTGSPWQRVANVYIAGHRLGYVGTPSWLAFWDLNKMEVGDKVFVIDSMGRRYVYRVFKEFIVDPDDVQVTRPVPGRNVLTLQTCTLPDYSRRLIVRAALEEGPVASTAGREEQ